MVTDMKTTTSQRLRYLMDTYGYRQVDILNKCLPFAQQFGVKLRKNYIHYYLTGDNVPSQDMLTVLALGLNVSEAWLMGFDVPMERTTNERINAVTKQKIPMLGEIACGTPIVANQEYECYTEAGADLRCDFRVRAKGDSMTGARITDGDVVFIREQPEVQNGEIAAVIIDDECTLKKVYDYSDRLVLQAENPNYEPLVYVGEEKDHVRILGKAVAFQSDLK